MNAEKNKSLGEKGTKKASV